MVSRSQFPWFESLLAGVAVTVTAVIWVAPASPYLEPRYQPVMLTLSGVWMLWRVLVLDRCLATRRAWHQTPFWEVTATDLTRRSQADPLLGRGFRWTEHHTQALEEEIRAVGALPVAPAPRGGTPALHAVGCAQEQQLRLPWSEFVGQMAIVGTTRSGKSVAMEVLLAQVIAHA